MGTKDKGVEASKDVKDADKNATKSSEVKKIVMPHEPLDKQATLFKRNNKLGKRKTVAFNHTRDFFCEIFHENGTNIPEGLSLELVKYNVSGLTAVVENPKNQHLLMFNNQIQKPRVSLHFALDSSGIIRLASAEASLWALVEERVKKRVKKNKTVVTKKKKLHRMKLHRMKLPRMEQSRKIMKRLKKMNLMKRPKKKMIKEKNLMEKRMEMNLRKEITRKKRTKIRIKMIRKEIKIKRKKKKRRMGLCLDNQNEEEKIYIHFETQKVECFV